MIALFFYKTKPKFYEERFFTLNLHLNKIYTSNNLASFTKISENVSSRASANFLQEFPAFSSNCSAV